MAILADISVLLLSILVSCVRGQQDFISIDCGKPEDYSYNDENTRLLYVSDYSYTESGKSYNISSELRISAKIQHQDLRSFPDGKRNCFSLKPVIVGNKYIIRAFFMYGNYDGLKGRPQFDLYIGTNQWTTVIISDESEAYSYEILAAATGDFMEVCLVNIGYGNPFISALELRPIANEVSYSEKVNYTISLATIARINFGALSDVYIRYPKEKYDRIWAPLSDSTWATLSTTKPIDLSADDSIPSEIMQTAATPRAGSVFNFSLSIDSTNVPRSFYISELFAELVDLGGSNQSRIFNFFENQDAAITNFSPTYLSMDYYYDNDPFPYQELKFSAQATRRSALPPIINAMEICMVVPMKESGTFVGDVDAITKIKVFFKIRRNWFGDPCSPIDFVWDGLKCSYTSKPYRIISLNLAASGLTGNLPYSLCNLTELKYLDLSTNNLTGGIPSFLADLPNLQLLNLTCSGLNGPTPIELLSRPSIKLLFSDSCLQVHQSNEAGKSRKNVLAIVLLVGGVFLVLVVLLILLLLWKWRKNHGPRRMNTEGADSAAHRNGWQWSQPYCRIFTTSELVKMTDNYKKIIGKGGFGDVFYGLLDNRKHVAVKKLTNLTPNSLTQFQAEIDALQRIHHRNLVPFIGYCEDKDGLALVYEYMPNGSLADHLSGKSGDGEIFTWSKRIQLAYEAAQGLEYLHVGCQRPIVHRDVKAANILLTENMEARIADFGLSKIFAAHGEIHASTKVMGTPGYLDPEYSKTGILTEKSDVYSFGIVLLELITGLPRYFGNTERAHIVEHVKNLLNNGDMQGIIDKSLLGAYEVNSARKAIDVALTCTAPNAVDRPTMSAVLLQLKDCCVTSEATYTGTDTNSYAGSDPRSITGPMANPSAR